MVKTDSKGKAKMSIDLKKGKYNVSVSFAGNDKFQGDNATQKLTIKEKKVEQEETTSSSSSEPAAYAYKSDGTPMYSQEEVSDYMLNKYGMVDYHVGENGYIDMDERGYDDAGNKIDGK